MRRLTWLCATCGRPVENGKGLVWCAPFDAWRAKARGQEWRPVYWRADHTACLGADEAYDIRVSELRTRRQLERWNELLRAKVWIGVTDWPALYAERMREAA